MRKDEPVDRSDGFAGGTAAPLARRVDHVGIVVRDVTEAARWWTERLGLDLVHVADVLDGTVRLAYLDLGDTTLQLVQPLEPGPLADWLTERGEGLHHICFLVDSVPSTLDALDDRGRRFVYLGGRGADVCFIGETPCSVLVELTEPTDPAWVAGGSTPVTVSGSPRPPTASPAS
jgi:methylmalonyl-CoA/ethylmalonyl-CoA epimerase